jgi:ethanolaminephosphotransferase
VSLRIALLRNGRRLNLAALLTFYVQTWDEYHTHTLTLGIVSGPVEGILTLCLVYALTAYLGGGSFWQKSMLETIGVSNSKWIPEALYQLAWNEWYLVYGGIMLVLNTVWRYDCLPPLLRLTILC